MNIGLVKVSKFIDQVHTSKYRPSPNSPERPLGPQDSPLTVTYKSDQHGSIRKPSMGRERFVLWKASADRSLTNWQ